MNKPLGKSCSQCGECCRKGGPLLHIEDMPLIREGHILFSKLITLRKGELAHNAIKNCLMPLAEEVIKIAGTKEQAYPWHCVFHNAAGCGLHPLRPAQCAALLCKDTKALEAMYEQDLANRKHLLSQEISPFATAWLELAESHEEQCSLATLKTLAADFEYNQDDILQMLRYDLAFRNLCVQKAHMPEDNLDCILGRSIGQLLQGFGLELRGKALVRVGKNYYCSNFR